MPSDPICALIVGVVLIVLGILSRGLCRRSQNTPAAPQSPRATRDPKPFAGFTHKPACPACQQEAEMQPSAAAPTAPPPCMLFTRGRRRYVETTGHFCPYAPCAYHGRVGWGHIRANGHPSGRRWRQLGCLSCQRHCLETHGTPFHGKRVEPDKRVWAIAALAEGLGIRAVARVFETDPNPFWAGWSRRPSPWRLSHAIPCAISTLSRCRWTNSSPCSVPSKTVRAASSKRSSACPVPRTGCGSRWTRCAS